MNSVPVASGACCNAAPTETISSVSNGNIGGLYDAYRRLCALKDKVSPICNNVIDLKENFEQASLIEKVNYERTLLNEIHCVISEIVDVI